MIAMMFNVVKADLPTIFSILIPPREVRDELEAPLPFIAGPGGRDRPPE